ncbi:hypothetical protein PG994_001033 [Apiospora phragmitis]|uniref:Uncharacterized protein n=1 Tax=Apiospora phragmitis TaxID=2905665 RepID=A0ABR1WSD9_9PEZI
MHLLPRWNVLLCGIVLLLGATALIHPYLRLRLTHPYVAKPWSPGRQGVQADEPALPPPLPPLKYKPAPTYTVPPIQDPFPLLSQTSTPPPIPVYNVPAKDAWKQYDGLAVAPPLLIGFTRNWPMLLQTVVSYLTAGWPADQLYVVENTGTQQANARAQLSLQNPRFLNHTQLRDVLGVRVVQTPVLLSFAQLQNFFLALSYEHGWPYYFWSHMDVVALSHEDGVPGLTEPAGQPGYKSLYTLCLETLQQTLRSNSNSSSSDDSSGGDITIPARSNKDRLRKFWPTPPSPKSPPSSAPPRWAARFFAYDHLTLQNPAALEAIGGWDTFIPYYMTDCDTYSRFAMDGWSVEPADAGVITDTAAVFDDLRALYRDPAVTPRFTDPNPPPPPPEEKKKMDSHTERRRRGRRSDGDSKAYYTPPSASSTTSSTTTSTQEKRISLLRQPPPPPPHQQTKRDVPFPHEPLNTTLPTDYWWQLRREADNMFHHKHGGARGRNTWQWAQAGGAGEPFHYDAAGFEEAVQLLTEAGKQLFARKWGHRGCDLGGRYRTGDQWRVVRDWE